MTFEQRLERCDEVSHIDVWGILLQTKLTCLVSSKNSEEGKMEQAACSEWYQLDQTLYCPIHHYRVGTFTINCVEVVIGMIT